ncbi:para-aminobenzoate synthase [Grosmannia clavigera kw1407]|uniref:aminodeoxychorismate synthase n=1 Tax=Grosmannia clavigera (strain kw1407 / UAMH 11150) TaxID=655863 RepID=F0XD03_GROCL|nr:para-aminobenzoate synthase [Grosmannia clavigera kw1407]EFX03625.1 para-aminobenzoate synthase [Grosmannia clavigera kw1407]
MDSRPRILFLDAYDSFANNVTALLATLLHADVRVLPVDAPLSAAAFRRELGCYDAVVCGPGPGSPDCAADVGLMRHVWDGDTPALGICLGFQSLVAAHGGRVVRLPCGGLHGMVRALDVVDLNEDMEVGVDLFADVARPFRATLYHSLGVVAGTSSSSASDLPGCPDLLPLAWLDGEAAMPDNSRILMAVRHRQRPFWGLQYHPESICTDAASHAVLVNWFGAAQQWNAEHGRLPTRGCCDEAAHQATRPSLLSLRPSIGTGSSVGDLWCFAALTRGLASQTIRFPAHVQVPDIVEVLLGGQPSRDEPEHIVLESTSAAARSTETDADAATTDDAARGRFSIVALDAAAALRIEYHTGDATATLRLRRPGSVPRCETVPLQPGAQSIWQLLAEFHEARRLQEEDPSQRPSFVGGFMGYVTYEQGLDDIGVAAPSSTRGHSRPDVCLAWITRSIVVDHVRGLLYVQNLYGEGDAHNASVWVADTVRRLCTSSQWRQADFSTTQATIDSKPAAAMVVRTPDARDYEDRVRACQEHIAAGDSYELCLTDQTDVQVTTSVAASSSSSSWSYYRALRLRNPAPFASYVRLGRATLVSSSPERFLSYGPSTDRDSSAQPGHPIVCSMRPMKGTVRRSAAVATLAQAAALLHVPKEEAENLMIVDLVRHDLHGVCGPAHVSVPALLRVEPHGRVFQMVSVVEGRLPLTDASTSSYTGLDVLAASLPPGSMTGAPKKRSCELLHRIESRPERSLYSGVVGYMCASGRGDWSVTIRSLFRWDDESVVVDGDGHRRDLWHVGAGGAVTILSTAEGEREEMLTKLAGPLAVFGDDDY